ncbi:MAG: cell division protein FtsQ/DivIB [Candidatus Omnitrophica bacterium]|nr:cell division protein FtsQ/DivIB [Candidatus Omnitrophota bacterium]MCF7894551.1 cell division protein FtsQ/DivIB [Candidatus Omnitrophota bacterium]
MARRRKNKKINIFKIFTNKFFIWIFAIFLIIGIFLLGGYQIYRADFFKVSERNLQSNLDINRNFMNKIKGKSVFNINLDKLHTYLIQQYPEYKEIKIIKKFPNFIKVEMKERKPIAQIRAKNFYLIDKNGVIVSRGENNPFESFPVINDLSFDQYLAKGRNIYNENVRAAFRLIDIIKGENLLEAINSLDTDYQFKLGGINVSSPETIYFYLKNKKYYQRRIKVILNRQDLQEKVSLLKRLVKQKLKDKLSLIRYIDFRFQKVAVGFKR